MAYDIHRRLRTIRSLCRIRSCNCMGNEKRILKMIIPEDPRMRMYYPIVIPVNKDGQGPCDLSEIAELTWEVWDQFLVSFGSYSYLQDAIIVTENLNYQYHVVGIRKEHQHGNEETRNPNRTDR